MAETSRRQRRTECTLFALLFLTFAYFYQGSGHNEAARFDTIRAFLEHGTMSVDEYAGNSADLVKIDGSFFSSKAPGTFLLGAPVFWTAARVASYLPLSDGLRLHLICDVTTILTISLLGALLGLSIFRFAVRIGSSARVAAAVALALVLGTNIFPFATLFMSHVATAGFLFFAFATLYEVKITVAPATARTEALRLLTAGFALGFAVGLEYPAVIGAAILVVYGACVLFHRRARAASWAAPAVGLLLGLAPMAWHNWVAFHDVLYVPYEAYLTDANRFFQAHQKGLLGVRLALFDPEFRPIFFSNLLNVTFAPVRGLFYNCPVLLLVFPGYWALASKAFAGLRAEAGVAGMMLVGYLSMNASFGDSIAYWGGGASFGPRHVIPALPFLVVPLVAGLSVPWVRWSGAVLAPLSIFICLMATSVEPRAPYSPSNPIIDYYAPRFFSGRLAENKNGVFSSELVTSDSVSFNLGKLAHLPGSWQLFPLYVVWALGGVALFRRPRQSPP